MVRKKNLYVLLVVCLSILILWPTTAFAAGNDIPKATNQFYINDFAGIIDDNVEKEMQERAVALAESSDGIQVVVTTVQTIGDADPVQYTVDMYKEYLVGKNNMGVLIMLSVETRDIQIRIGRNMTKYLSDRKSGEIIDEYGIPYFKNEQFSEGLYEMQKATIEYISGNVKTAAEEENASTELDAVKSKNSWRMVLGIFATIGIGILAFFGFDKYFKKRKEKKEAEEIAKIENSEIVQKKNQRIQRLEAELVSQKNDAKIVINEKKEKISSLTTKLEAAEREVHKLKERNKRAIKAYPDLDAKIDAIFAKEKEEADKKKALEVEAYIKEVLKLECTRQHLDKFRSACNAFENLSHEQKGYVPSELVNKVKKLYNESEKLQRQFEEEEKIRKDKEKAAKVQALIVAALTCSVTRHVVSELSNVCHAYDNLTNEQKKYVTADVEALYAMKKKAKRLQDEYEEEERRRRQREEEERRRRQREEEERRRRQNAYNSSSTHYGGFGGGTDGHGAGRKF